MDDKTGLNAFLQSLDQYAKFHEDCAKELGADPDASPVTKAMAVHHKNLAKAHRDTLANFAN